MAQLRARGYDAERVALPFKWYPKEEILRARGRVAPARSEREQRPADRSRRSRTKFPTYFARHPNKVAWLIHQYRAAYELVRHEYSDFEHVEERRRACASRSIDLDTKMLRECRRIFTNARNTAARLAKFNGLTAEPLYHPPHLADRLRPGPYGDYVLAVGRLETVKRPQLAIEAMAHASIDRVELWWRATARSARTSRPCGGAGVGDRVRFLGAVSDEDCSRSMRARSRWSIAPFDEDFGYVTLEAFLARKPVITASDSGGTLEFVVDGVNGAIVEPEAGGAGRGDRSARGRSRRRRPATVTPATPGRAGVTLGRRDREAGGRLTMANLIIQIPCLNEAETLPGTLADLPRHVPGIDRIEILVIDDGSRDDTADVARAHGVAPRRALPPPQGPGCGVHGGHRRRVKLGADFIVNTDADNQYVGADIALLIEPLLAGRGRHRHRRPRTSGDSSTCSGTKKLLQRLGSWVVRQVSGTEVPDTTSGFRAYTREAALRMTIVSEFSYTLESIIQAGKKRHGDRARAGARRTRACGPRACSTACSRT